MSVIVTGAAGHLGRTVTEQLLERLPLEDLVLVTRRPQALRELVARGADVRYGDFDDPATLPDAFAGGDRMLLISGDAWVARSASTASPSTPRRPPGSATWFSRPRSTPWPGIRSAPSPRSRVRRKRYCSAAGWRGQCYGSEALVHGRAALLA